MNELKSYSDFYPHVVIFLTQCQQSISTITRTNQFQHRVDLVLSSETLIDQLSKVLIQQESNLVKGVVSTKVKTPQRGKKGRSSNKPTNWEFNVPDIKKLTQQVHQIIYTPTGTRDTNGYNIGDILLAKLMIVWLLWMEMVLATQGMPQKNILESTDTASTWKDLVFKPLPIVARLSFNILRVLLCLDKHPIDDNIVERFQNTHSIVFSQLFLALEQLFVPCDDLEPWDTISFSFVDPLFQVAVNTEWNLDNRMRRFIVGTMYNICQDDARWCQLLEETDGVLVKLNILLHHLAISTKTEDDQWFCFMLLHLFSTILYAAPTTPQTIANFILSDERCQIYLQLPNLCKSFIFLLEQSKSDLGIQLQPLAHCVYGLLTNPKHAFQTKFLQETPHYIHLLHEFMNAYIHNFDILKEIIRILEKVISVHSNEIHLFNLDFDEFINSLTNCLSKYPTDDVNDKEGEGLMLENIASMLKRILVDQSNIQRVFVGSNSSIIEVISKIPIKYCDQVYSPKYRKLISNILQLILNEITVNMNTMSESDIMRLYSPSIWVAIVGNFEKDIDIVSLVCKLFTLRINKNKYIQQLFYNLNDTEKEIIVTLLTTYRASSEMLLVILSMIEVIGQYLFYYIGSKGVIVEYKSNNKITKCTNLTLFIKFLCDILCNDYRSDEVVIKIVQLMVTWQQTCTPIITGFWNFEYCVDVVLKVLEQYSSHTECLGYLLPFIDTAPTSSPIFPHNGKLTRYSKRCQTILTTDSSVNNENIVRTILTLIHKCMLVDHGSHEILREFTSAWIVVNPEESPYIIVSLLQKWVDNERIVECVCNILVTLQSWSMFKPDEIKDNDLLQCLLILLPKYTSSVSIARSLVKLLTWWKRASSDIIADERLFQMMMSLLQLYPRDKEIVHVLILWLLKLSSFNVLHKIEWFIPLIIQILSDCSASQLYFNDSITQSIWDFCKSFLLSSKSIVDKCMACEINILTIIADNLVNEKLSIGTKVIILSFIDSLTYYIEEVDESLIIREPNLIKSVIAMFESCDNAGSPDIEAYFKTFIRWGSIIRENYGSYHKSLLEKSLKCISQYHADSDLLILIKYCQLMYGINIQHKPDLVNTANQMLHMTLVNILRKHKKELNVSKAVCCSLASMITRPQDISMLVSIDGACDLVVHSMRYHQSNELVALKVLSILHTIIYECAEELHDVCSHRIVKVSNFFDILIATTTYYLPLTTHQPSRVVLLSFSILSGILIFDDIAIKFLCPPINGSKWLIQLHEILLNNQTLMNEDTIDVIRKYYKVLYCVYKMDLTDHVHAELHPIPSILVIRTVELLIQSVDHTSLVILVNDAVAFLLCAINEDESHVTLLPNSLSWLHSLLIKYDHVANVVNLLHKLHLTFEYPEIETIESLNQLLRLFEMYRRSNFNDMVAFDAVSCSLAWFMQNPTSRDYIASLKWPFRSFNNVIECGNPATPQPQHVVHRMIEFVSLLMKTSICFVEAINHIQLIEKILTVSVDRPSSTLLEFILALSEGLHELKDNQSLAMVKFAKCSGIIPGIEQALFQVNQSKEIMHACLYLLNVQVTFASSYTDKVREFSERMENFPSIIGLNNTWCDETMVLFWSLMPVAYSLLSRHHKSHDRLLQCWITQLEDCYPIPIRLNVAVDAFISMIPVDDFDDDVLRVHERFHELNNNLNRFEFCSLWIKVLSYHIVGRHIPQVTKLCQLLHVLLAQRVCIDSDNVMMCSLWYNKGVLEKLALILTEWSTFNDEIVEYVLGIIGALSRYACCSAIVQSPNLNEDLHQCITKALRCCCPHPPERNYIAICTMVQALYCTTIEYDVRQHFDMVLNIIRDCIDDVDTLHPAIRAMNNMVAHQRFITVQPIQLYQCLQILLTIISTYEHNIEHSLLLANAASVLMKLMLNATSLEKGVCDEVIQALTRVIYRHFQDIFSRLSGSEIHCSESSFHRLMNELSSSIAQGSEISHCSIDWNPLIKELVGIWEEWQLNTSIWILIYKLATFNGNGDDILIAHLSNRLPLLIKLLEFDSNRDYDKINVALRCLSSIVESIPEQLDSIDVVKQLIEALASLLIASENDSTLRPARAVAFKLFTTLSTNLEQREGKRSTTSGQSQAILLMMLRTIASKEDGDQVEERDIQWMEALINQVCTVHADKKLPITIEDITNCLRFVLKSISPVSITGCVNIVIKLTETFGIVQPDVWNTDNETDLVLLSENELHNVVQSLLNTVNKSLKSGQHDARSCEKVVELVSLLIRCDWETIPSSLDLYFPLFVNIGSLLKESANLISHVLHIIQSIGFHTCASDLLNQYSIFQLSLLPLYGHSNPDISKLLLQLAKSHHQIVMQILPTSVTVYRTQLIEYCVDILRVKQSNEELILYATDLLMTLTCDSNLVLPCSISQLGQLLQRYQFNALLVRNICVLLNCKLHSDAISANDNTHSVTLIKLQQILVSIQKRYCCDRNVTSCIQQVIDALLPNVPHNAVDAIQETQEKETKERNNVEDTVPLTQSPIATITKPITSALHLIIDAAELEFDSRIDANIYKGMWRQTSVAIKRYPSVKLSTLSSSSDLIREVDILSSLRHPRIVSLFGCCNALSLFTEGSFGGLILEHMLKGDLRTLLNTHHSSLALLNKLKIATDLSEGMKFLHSTKMVHRELKSMNILVDGEGRAKLSGFGEREQHIESSASIAKYTFTPMNCSLDVYDFGVILWELHTGKVPWESKTMKHAKLALTSNETKECHPDWLKLMNHCMESVIVSNTKGHSTLELSFDDIYATLKDMVSIESTRIDNKLRAIPDGFLCPITQDIMKDPVMLVADGQSYERKELVAWLQRGNRSPLTNEPLPSIRVTHTNGTTSTPLILMENYALKSAIESFLNNQKI